MPDVIYEVVQHDGGWAYKVDGVFSETFPTHAEASLPRSWLPRSRKSRAISKISSMRTRRASGTPRRSVAETVHTRSLRMWTDFLVRSVFEKMSEQ